jgi:hypothetical protein
MSYYNLGVFAWVSRMACTTSSMLYRCWSVAIRSAVLCFSMLAMIAPMDQQAWVI